MSNLLSNKKRMKIFNKSASSARRNLKAVAMDGKSLQRLWRLILAISLLKNEDHDASLSRGLCQDSICEGSESLLFRGGFLECSPGTLMMTKWLGAATGCKRIRTKRKAS